MATERDEMIVCPCGSRKEIVKCCERFISGKRHAPTALELMRSRYTAAVSGNIDCIEETQAGKAAKNFDRVGFETYAAERFWTGLRVVSTSEGLRDQKKGIVAFSASYMMNGEVYYHNEKSHFRCEDGRWYFVDSEPLDDPGCLLGGNAAGVMDYS